jgi:Asp-tRNA(Asn)/Glu-tRNA(Gln) amidotransferase A subunit family amidase
LATGSDGAGSTRIPAAWCGVVGVKPTNARRMGQDAVGLSVGGPLARNVFDAAAYLDAELGGDLAAAAAATAAPTRAAWTATLGFATTDPHVASVARTAAERLASAGILTWTDTRIELLDPEAAWHSLRTGNGDAQTVRGANDRRLAHAFSTVDLIVTPTTPARAHGHDGPGSVMNVSLTWAFNISGHPAISVPAGFTDDGTPVGLQLVARHNDEARLIRVAAAFERIAPWPAPALAKRGRRVG